MGRRVLNTKWAWAVIGLGMYCNPAGSAAADLLETYRLAQAGDPTFEAARYSFETAREKLPQAFAGLLPSMELTGSRNHTDSTAKFTNTPAAHRGIYSWTWNVQLTQPLFRLQNWMAYDESESLVAEAQAEYAKAEQDLILRLAQAYFGVLISEEDVRAAEMRQQALEEQGNAAKRNYELGTASVTDYYEAKSKAGLARSDLVAARNDLENKRAELEKITGKTFDMLAPLRSSIYAQRIEPNDPTAWIEQAKANNPDVRMLEAAVRAAESAVGKARAANVGTVDFVASYGANYSSGNISIPSNYETRGKSTVAGIQFTMPIFEGGKNNSQIREAVAGQGKAAAQLEEARRKAGAEARQAYAAIVSGMSQVEALKAAADAGESSLKGNRVGYKMGLRINSDVLDAQQQLYASRRDLAKARYETVLQGLRLKAAAGILTAKDVEEVNEMLER